MILDTHFAGGREKLARQVFAAAREEVARRGASLEITGNLDAFHAVDRGGALPFDAHHPDYTVAVRGASIVVRAGAEPIATGTAALYDTYERSMADLIRENGVYNDGAPARIDMSRECLDWLESIAGRVMYSGGVWIRADRRKSEFSRLLVPLIPLVARTVAVQLWDAQHIVSFLEHAIAAKGIARRYRAWFAWPGMVWRARDKDVPLMLAYTAPIQATLDARAFIRSGSESLVSPSTPPERSGSIRRAA